MRENSIYKYCTRENPVLLEWDCGRCSFWCCAIGTGRLSVLRKRTTETLLLTLRISRLHVCVTCLAHDPHSVVVIWESCVFVRVCVCVCVLCSPLLLFGSVLLHVET